MPRAALTGTRIRERRAQLGLKQAELARSVEVSPALLNLIEHNRRRVSEPLLIRLAAALQTEPAILAEGAESRLYDALRLAAAAERPDPAGTAPPPPELDRIEEFTGRYPGWAALLAERQERVGALERLADALGERLAHDPRLSASLHDVLSAVTSVRSTAAILAETEDIDPDWRARFHANLHDDGERLAHAAEALVAYLDAGSDEATELRSPQEELEAWIARHDGRPEAADGGDGGKQDGEGNDGGGDAETRIRTAPELTSPEARALARGWLARAEAEALALPEPAFRRALAEIGPDPGRLAARFGAAPLAVFRRLAALADPAPGLVLCDGSGTPTLRRPVEGFTLPRFGAACPLWPLYLALIRPGQPLRATVEMAGRMPARFLAYALCETRWPEGFDGPPVVEAGMLLFPLDGPAEPGDLGVGSTCRVCPREACAARREPSLLTG
ncbi:helix-turn-helix domain-containing protein [Frigidibacter sp. MR17.24]|uniref:helix-turn-helix domain-containing protein n=1 Tax=Frigidibacter sp. MR17.24 TaxID=3127345 RepID=UPI003012FEE9